MTRFRSLAALLALAMLLIAGAYAAFDGGMLRGQVCKRFMERNANTSTQSTHPLRPVTQEIERPGDYFFRIPFDGLMRLYRIHVPPGYAKDKPVPLLFAFHGGGGNMDYEADDRYYHLVSKSDQAGFVAVFPNGYSRFPDGKLATWNAGNCCAAARDKNIDDVGFVRRIVRNLEAQLNVDHSRIFATGMSNGAIFAHRLACEMADTFSAIASVAGSDGTRTCHPSRPVSVLEIHALDDDFVLFDGGAGKRSRTLTDFVSTPETVARWVRRDHCNAKPIRVLDMPGQAYCDQYGGCAGGARVRLCVTNTGGHSWPGGIKVRTGEPGSTAFNATDMLWDFFNGR